MPKKSKNTSAAPTDEIAPVSLVAPQRTKSGAKKSGTKAKAASAKAARKKKTTAATAKRRAPKKAADTPTQVPQPSDADIRLRAYFIAERRVQLALHGDPALDWIEAREQLLAEARQPRS